MGFSHEETIFRPHGGSPRLQVGGAVLSSAAIRTHMRKWALAPVPGFVAILSLSLAPEVRHRLAQCVSAGYTKPERPSAVGAAHIVPKACCFFSCLRAMDGGRAGGLCRIAFGAGVLLPVFCHRGCHPEPARAVCERR